MAWSFRRVKEAASTGDLRVVAVGALLLGTTIFAWISVVRASLSMQMNHGPTPLSLPAGAAFTLEWGVMMTAMMLPSGAPMILLYSRIRQRAGASGARVVPAEVFALTYVLLWLLTGVPVYLASVAVARAAASSPAFLAAEPFMVAATLFAAGLYQLTPVKHACLRQCEAPHDFLMRRWRGGYAPSLRLAATHAAYCIGCCWALMVVLVVAGAMSLPWVLTIALAVFAEKILPRSGLVARIIGVALIAAGLAVAWRGP